MKFSFIFLAFLVGLAIAYEGNYALQFDGQRDFVIFDFEEDLDNDLTKGEWTLEAWIKPSINQIYSGIGPKQVNIVGVPHRAPNLELTFNNEPLTQLREDSGKYYTITATDSVKVGEWSHVAGSWDGTQLNIYVNGVLEISSTPQDSGYQAPRLCLDDCNLGFFLGGYHFFNTSQQYFHGEIDDVRIWNVGLSESEIKKNMKKVIDYRSAGLLYYWRFDEGKGSVVQSGTQYPNIGILGGMNSEASPQWVKSNAPLSEAHSLAPDTLYTEREEIHYTKPFLYGMFVGVIFLAGGFLGGVFFGRKYPGSIMGIQSTERQSSSSSTWDSREMSTSETSELPNLMEPIDDDYESGGDL